MLYSKNQGKNMNKSKSDSETKLRTFAFLDDELMKDFNVSMSGLSTEQVKIGQDEFDENVITVAGKSTTLHRLKEATINPFNIVLFVIAIITLFTGVLSTAKTDYWTIGIIFCYDSAFQPFGICTRQAFQCRW